ncbi:cytoplasmic protein [Stappia sp. ES.058]|uniref:cytoplasmic protein n=1 Tax=Stappia sp. ES.058 TaxID=1881061 RepID=UPI00087BE15F|nr:cytoplasmic protein [Stappia sp. ES.058]SDU28760.1 hypothetical protein SAMN05428979_2756 [Stappia sp. ES.058]
MHAFARRSRRILAAGAVGLFLALAPTLQPAEAGGGDRPYFSWNGEPRVPTCDTAAVRRAVAGQIARADADYLGGIAIEDMSRVVETAYTQGRPSPYARRFCEARAEMSDGRTRRVYYAIMEHSGFVGVSWNLRACVAGLDPWRVYDARCRTVRP